MNKYLVLIGILIALIILSITYIALTLPSRGITDVIGVRRDITMTFNKDTQSFFPRSFTVMEGDSVYIKFINEDTREHGFANDLFVITATIPAKSTILLPPFIASKAGSFIFYCPVSEDAHLDEIGTLIVRPSNSKE